MKETTLKAAIAVAMAAATAYLRELAIPVFVLAGVMVIDYLSGMVSAWVKCELSSRVGVLGIVKKVAYLLAVAVAIVEYISILENISEIGVPLPAFLLKLIEKLKKTVENTGENETQ